MTTTTSSIPERRHSRTRRLTKQAPVQLNVTPPPPDRETQLNAMLLRVSDRRIMYAKSRFSFKARPNHAYRVSQETTTAGASVIIDSLEGGGSGEAAGPSKSSQGTSRLELPGELTSRQHIDKSNSSYLAPHNETFEQPTDSSIPQSQLLDPTQIPLNVRKSLLDMHYHLHQKPALLQTSRISRSDSNIKVPPYFIFNKNKLLSLQKSSYD